MTHPEASPAERFAAIMWGYFVDGAAIDGAAIDGFDLECAIEASGLGTRRPAELSDIEGTRWQGEVEVGDQLTFLTAEGKVGVTKGQRAMQKARVAAQPADITRTNLSDLT